MTGEQIGTAGGARASLLRRHWMRPTLTLASLILPVTSIDQISIVGFSDPTTVAELRRTRCANVPSHTGIFLIERGAEGG
jgi:hypothetical protein